MKRCKSLWSGAESENITAIPCWTKNIVNVMGHYLWDNLQADFAYKSPWFGGGGDCGGGGDDDVGE